MTRRPRLYLALSLLWAGFIGFALLVPLSPENEDYLPSWLARLLVPGADRLVHGLLFFVLAYLLLGAFAGRRSLRGALAFLLSAAYGALTEWAQGALGTRSAELSDFVADLLGALLGVVVVWAWGAASDRRSRSRSSG